MSCIEYTDAENAKKTYLVQEFSAGASTNATKVELFDADTAKTITVELPVSLDEFQQTCRRTEIPSFRAAQPR